MVLWQAIRAPLDPAHEATSLLPSLRPLWEEEEARCGGAIPQRPPSPPRAPKPLCTAVEAVRAELMVSMGGRGGGRYGGRRGEGGGGRKGEGRV